MQRGQHRDWGGSDGLEFQTGSSLQHTTDGVRRRRELMNVVAVWPAQTVLLAMQEILETSQPE